ncbi:MAG: hypothetical protein FJ100_03830 [Deltaproteobacteria bacterium]|nr:hypothetical protein [Deltaproteobacteria bacterium]
MVDILHGSSAPAQSDANDLAPAEALTLHRDVASRWSAAGRLSVLSQARTLAAVHGHDGWIKNLGGLGALAGGFGPQAWNLATQIAASPAFLARLATQTRSLQVGELADLVQIVLEELEFDGDGFEFGAELAELHRELHQSRAKDTAKQAGRTPVAGRKPTRADQANRSPAKAARSARSRAALGKQAQLRDLRRLVQQFRNASEASEGAQLRDGAAGQRSGAAPQGGVWQPHMPTPSGQQGPDEFGRVQAGHGDHHPGVASFAAGSSADLGQGHGLSSPPRPGDSKTLRRRTLEGLMARPARLGGEPGAHPLWTLGETNRAFRLPRAMRWAEASADRALVEPLVSDGVNDAAQGDDQVVRSRTAMNRAAVGPGNHPAPTTPTRGAEQRAAAAVHPASTGTLRHQEAAALWRQNLVRAVDPRPRLAATASAAVQRVGFSPIPAGSRATRDPEAPSAGLSAGLAAAESAGAPPAFAALHAAAARARHTMARAEAAGRFVESAKNAALSHWNSYFAAADSAQAGKRSSAGHGPSHHLLGSAFGAPASPAMHAARVEGNGPDTLAPESGIPWRAVAAGLRAPISARAPGEGLADLAASRAEAAPGDLVALHQDWAGDQLADAAGSLAALRQAAGHSAQVASGRSAVAGVVSPAALAPWWTGPSGAPGAKAWLASRQSAGAVVSGAAGRAAGRPSAPGAIASHASSGPLPGLAGLAAIGFGQRVDARVSMGLGPTSQVGETALRPTGLSASQSDAFQFAPVEVSPSAGRMGRLSAAAAGLWQSAGTVALGGPGSAVQVTGRDRVARDHALADAGAGAGEWLDLGAGNDDATAAPAVVPAVRRTNAYRADAERMRGRTQAPTAALSYGSAIRPPVAVAAQSAVAALVRARTHARTAIDAGGGRVAATALAAAAGLRDVGVLAARPDGKADALSAWVSQVAGSAPRLSLGSGFDGWAARSAPPARLRTARADQQGPGTWLDLGAAEILESAGIESGAHDGAKRHDGRALRAAGVRTTAQSPDRVSPGRATPAALGADVPPALKATLMAWGESASAMPADAAAAFVAKFLGRNDIVREVRRRMAQAATARHELVAPQSATAGAEASAAPPASRPSAPARAGRSATAAQGVQATAQGDDIVLSGMAALAALTGGDLFGAPKGRGRAAIPSDASRELLKPAAEVPDRAASATAAADSRAPVATATSTAAKATATPVRALAGVQMHAFAPVGLRRGQNLLGQARRARWLHATPRGTFSTRLSSARSAARSGYATGGFSYGGAGPGASELVGLTGSDGGWYLGETAPAPSAVRGADRLSSAVAARRSAAIGRTAGPSASPAGAAPGFVEGMAMPSDFRAGQDLVQPAAGMDAMVEAANRGGGATAAHKGTQAAAMTRVLSVTAAPTANMLPLVAPAAQAIVAAAAAKPLSEGIATSGGDATYGTPIVGVGDHKAGKAGQGAGGDKARQQAEDQASNVQDIEALAVKVARSVMVRIKRERERRGLHV